VEEKDETRRQAGKTVKNTMTAVMQKPESEWEVVAFHYGPVQKREGEKAGFVIRVVSLDQRR
jgi:hypothetical protein